MRDTFKILYIPVCIYNIYIYIYYVPATKLCNKEYFSLKMLRRTVKVLLRFTFCFGDVHADIRPVEIHSSDEKLD